MQGYDAVTMKTDVQVGGTDQLFNIIVAGRKLQEALGQKPLVGVICGILPGTDGMQRMSKSTGNVIPINTTAADMYGKVMSVPDVAMENLSGYHAGCRKRSRHWRKMRLPASCIQETPKCGWRGRSFPSFTAMRMPGQLKKPLCIIPEEGCAG